MAAQVGDIVKNITDDVKTIVRGEIELAKAELVPAGKSAGAGAGMFGAAGYLALNAASLLFMAGGFGLGLLFTELLDWPLLAGAALGFVIMAVLLLAVAAALALAGKGKLKQVKAPERTQKEAAATVDAVKAAVERGTAAAKGELPSGAKIVAPVTTQDRVEPTLGATAVPR